MNIAIEFCIFELIYVTNFTLNEQFWILGSNFAQKTVFPVENGKSEHRHRILHIWIGCGNKFHLKQFLILGLNFPKNSISGRKLKKWTSPWYTVVFLTIWHTYSSNSDWSTLDFLLTDVTKVL